MKTNSIPHLNGVTKTSLNEEAPAGTGAKQKQQQSHYTTNAVGAQSETTIDNQAVRCSTSLAEQIESVTSSFPRLSDKQRAEIEERREMEMQRYVTKVKIDGSGAHGSGSEIPEDLRQRIHPARASDLGNAERFVALKGDDFRFTKGHGWLTWSGSHWVADDIRIYQIFRDCVVPELYREAAAAATAHNGALSAELAKWAKRTEQDKQAKGALEVAKSLPGICVPDSDFDQDLFSFNVLNGTIDLRTGKLRPHRREDLITRISPVVFDPAASCPTWEAFLLRIMNGRVGLVSFLKRIIGYMLSGDTSEQCLFYAYGTGKNGKSTFIDTISRLVGEYGRRADIETFMSSKVGRVAGGNSPDIAAVSKARLVFASETEEGRRFSMATLKDMTSGERQTACMKYKNPFEFVPEWKIWLSGNHRPLVGDTTEGAWRRINLIPFDVHISAEECDQKLPEKLRAELPGILAAAVRGFLEWQSVGLQPPPEVIAATNDYRESQDAVGQFVRDCCFVDKHEREQVAKLYEAYVEWCEDGGEKYHMPKRTFTNALTEKGFRRVDGNGKTRMIQGLRLGERENL